jgi:hypothetical protein
MSRPRKSLAPRDQFESTFGAILLRLCGATGARGAALVDQEGETVDYAGYLTPFQMRVTAAEWRLVLGLVREVPHPNIALAHQVLLRCAKRSYAIVGLPDGYALVLELNRHAFALSRRAVSEASREIRAEAGLESPPGERASEHWSRVAVQTADGDERRPAAIWLEGEWTPLTILGRYAASTSGQREIAYRARLPTGLEFALVREPLGTWFAEDLPDPKS